MIAYVLIVTTGADEHEVYNALSKTAEVEEVWPLFSEWDILVKIVAETVEELGRIICEKITPLEGVLTIKTLIGY